MSRMTNNRLARLLEYLLIASTGGALLLAVGCTTLTVGGRNGHKVSFGVKTYIDGETTPSGEFTMIPGEVVEPQEIGSYWEDTEYDVHLLAPNGAIIRRVHGKLPGDPDPFPVEFVADESIVLGAPRPSTIEDVWRDAHIVRPSHAPLANGAQALAGYIGGIYELVDEGEGILKFERIASAADLGIETEAQNWWNRIRTQDLSQAPEVRMTLNINSSNYGSLSAAYPELGSLNLTFERGETFQTQFLLKNATWWALEGLSAYGVMRRIDASGTAEQKQTRKVIIDALQAGKNLYFLNEAFVIGEYTRVKKVATKVKAGVQYSGEGFVTAEGAFEWTKTQDAEDSARAVVFRCGFNKLQLVYIKAGGPEMMLLPPQPGEEPPEEGPGGRFEVLEHESGWSPLPH